MNKDKKISARFVFRSLGLFAAVMALLVSAASFSQNLKVDHPEEYVVKKGDTLWDISAMFLDDPWLWPEIWHINEQVANPHLIYPGDVLRLIYVDGQPRIVLDKGVIKLSPQIRSVSHEDAITSIPLDAVREFFTKNRVVTQEELEAAPYMLSGPEGRIMVGAGDTLYARGPFERGVNVYQIFREGDEYRDPETGDLLGIRGESKGTARYQNTSGEISRVGVIESIAEIAIGDRLLPLEQDQLDPQLFPTIPRDPVFGQIIAVEGGVSQIGMLDVVAINRGQDANLEIGHLLAIMQSGDEVRDRVAGGTVRLPDEQSGMLMVFKVYDQMSFGLVLDVEKVLEVGYQVTNLFASEAYEAEKQRRQDEEDKKGIFHDFTNMFDPGTRPD